jgi:DnaJ-like protein
VHKANGQFTEDPAEFFSMIFGGEAFHDWIGELSLMKDLTKTMDITMREEEEAAAAEEAGSSKAGHVDPAAATAAAASMSSAPPPPHVEPDQKAAYDKAFDGTQDPPPNLHVYDDPHLSAPSHSPALSGSGSGASTPRPSGVPTRLAIEHSPSPSTEHLTPSEAANMTEEEKKLREKSKKKGLTKEQREELAAYEMERKRQRDERVTTLAKKLVDRLSVWTETDRGNDVTRAFKAQINLEIENLRMESFGIEILHAMGATYLMKGTSFLKSQKLFGISGFWSRLKEKGTLAKETWTTISTAIDAQVTMEEMARLEERGGEEWTDERKAEYEKRVTGKILAAAWRGSKFEIQSILREVCEKVLNDKTVKLEKRVERAQGLVIIGEMFSKVSCHYSRRRCLLT